MKLILIKLLIFLIWLSVFSGASYMITKELRTQNFSKLIKVWMISTIFILIAIPISLYGILQHLIHYTKPFLQLYIIRVLWMVPIYTMNAWVALRFPRSAIYLDTLRECYEAYVIYNFTTFLLNYLKCSLDLVATLEEKRVVSHIFPANLILPRWKPGWPFILNCKRGVLQYTVIRPLMTVVAFVTEMFGVYNEGVFSFKYAWIYTVIINNISQVFAMYCLIIFYKATYQELRPMKPLGKFFCVKAIVFASFWQSVLIAFLVHTKILTEKNTWETRDSQTLQASLQDFCICIEMFVAAIAHYICFPATPFEIEDSSPHSNETNSLNSNTNNNINNDPNKLQQNVTDDWLYPHQSCDDINIIDRSGVGGGKRTLAASIIHSLKVVFNVSDVYEDVHQQVNIMIKSNTLKNRYRDQMLQNTNIMAKQQMDPQINLINNKNNNNNNYKKNNLGGGMKVNNDDDELILTSSPSMCPRTPGGGTIGGCGEDPPLNLFNNKSKAQKTVTYNKFKDEIA